MSIRRYQTHAGLVVHVERPTEKDVKSLREEFSLHPLDGEAMLRISEQSELGSYHNYRSLQLGLPWQVGQDSVMVDVLSFVNEKFLLLVHDTPERTIHTALERLAALPDATPMQVLTDVMVDIGAQAEHSIPRDMTPATRSYLARAWDTLEQFATQEEAQLDLADQSAWRLAIHRLKHVDRLLDEPQTILPSTLVTHAPRAAMSYAVASFMLFITVLWALH